MNVAAVVDTVLYEQDADLLAQYADSEAVLGGLLERVAKDGSLWDEAESVALGAAARREMTEPLAVVLTLARWRAGDTVAAVALSASLERTDDGTTGELAALIVAALLDGMEWRTMDALLRGEVGL